MQFISAPEVCVGENGGVAGVAVAVVAERKQNRCQMGAEVARVTVGPQRCTVDGVQGCRLNKLPAMIAGWHSCDITPSVGGDASGASRWPRSPLFTGLDSIIIK